MNNLKGTDEVIALRSRDFEKSLSLLSMRAQVTKFKQMIIKRLMKFILL